MCVNGDQIQSMVNGAGSSNTPQSGLTGAQVEAQNNQTNEPTESTEIVSEEVISEDHQGTEDVSESDSVTTEETI